MDVLTLTLYGIMLFPNVQDLVDYAAIDVFIASKTQQKIESQQSQLTSIQLFICVMTWGKESWCVVYLCFMSGSYLAQGKKASVLNALLKR